MSHATSSRSSTQKTATWRPKPSSGTSRNPGSILLRYTASLTSTGGWKYLEVVATNCLDDPAVAGIVVNARDVTESQRLLKALRTLGQANQVLVHAKDETSLLQETCRTIVDAGDYQLAWVGFARHDEQRGVERVAAAGRVEFLDDISVTWSTDDTGQGPVGVAIRSGAVQAYGDLSVAIKEETNRTAALKHGLQSNCVLPLLRCGRGHRSPRHLLGDS